MRVKTWKRWTQEEDRAVLTADRYGDLKQLARQLGRGYGPVRQRRHLLRRKEGR